MKYLRERAEAMGGPLPRAQCEADRRSLRRRSRSFTDALGGSRGREASTTTAFVSVLKTLMKHPELGKLIVPIVPDEARTFGMESLFREYGIYASQGQLYKPVDAEHSPLLQGSAERADSGRGHHRSGLHGLVHRGRNRLRQLRRADDSVLHLLFDVRIPARGRPDLGLRRFARQGLPDGRHGGAHAPSPGEGLQHQDGHSPMLASTVPTCAHLRSGLRV